MRKSTRAHPSPLRAPMLAMALTALIATPAMTQTVVEKRLAALEPCSALKTSQKMLGVRVAIAIDELEGVVVNRATVTLAGDAVTLSLVGGLSCRASDDSALKGDASLDFTAAAAINLTDCSIRSLSITPTRFGGSLAEVVKSGWEPLIRPKLEAKTKTMLVDACTDFVRGK